MDFKLNIMKYISITILLLSSCSKNSYQKFDYNKSDNPWIEAFKDNVFFACLKESYKNDTIFKLIDNRDAFNPYDGLSLDDLNKTKELAKKLVNNMPKAAMCENCKEGENYYMSNSLHYYASKELDSIAKEEYKNHLKMQKKSLWAN